MHGIKIQHQEWFNIPTGGCQNCKTSQIFVSGGYVKVIESLYTQVITWVNTILNQICLGLNAIAWYTDPNSIKHKNTAKYLYPIGIKKCEILTINT